MSWSKEYKKSVDCDNPQGFSQTAHCAARKKRAKGEETQSKSPFTESKEVTTYPKFSHKTKHLPKSQHQLDPNLDIKQLVHHAVHQYVDRDADGDIDVYDKPGKKTPDENVMSAPGEAQKRSLKLIAKQKGEMIHSMKRIAYEETNLLEGRRDKKRAGDPGYSLRDWFKGGGWVQVAGKYKGKPCAKQPGQKTKPFCRDADDAAAMSKAEKERRTNKKRKEDPNPERKGKAKMVNASYQPEGQQLDENPLIGLGVKAGLAAGTAVMGKMVYDKAEKVADKIRERNQKMQQQIDQINQSYELEGQSIEEKKDACYHKVKSRYSVWPSAYASGALVKCRKVGADSWGTKSESVEEMRYCPACRKNETKEECKFGPRYWEMFGQRLNDPQILTANQIKYDPNRPHPANEEKDHEYSMARSELSTIISAARRLKKKMKGEGSIEAWVQSKITKAADYIDTAADYVESGEHNVDEGITVQNSDGKDTVQFIDIIRPEPLKPSQGIGSQLIDEASKKCWPGYKKKGTQELFGKKYNRCVKEEYSNWKEELGLTEDWQKVNRKDKTDGLSQAAVDAYRRENPSSKLQTAVTEKKPKGKRAKRRKNFCSRMKGHKAKNTSAETARDPDSRINKALRRWNCN